MRYFIGTMAVICLLVLSFSFVSCGPSTTDEQSISIPCLTEDPAKAAGSDAGMETKEKPTTDTNQDNGGTSSLVQTQEDKKPVQEAKPLMLPKVKKVGRETCIPCATMTKRFAKMSPELEGKAEFELIDIEKDPSAIQTYQLQSIPLIIFYDTSGNEVYRQVGVMDEQEIIGWLEICGMKR